MNVFLVVFLIVGVVLAGMSVGVILGRKPIAGTCGGIGALGMGQACDICGGDDKKCEDENERLASEGKTAKVLAYDATQSGDR